MWLKSLRRVRAGIFRAELSYGHTMSVDLSLTPLTAGLLRSESNFDFTAASGVSVDSHWGRLQITGGWRKSMLCLCK